jgi:hypothetical protein
MEDDRAAGVNAARRGGEDQNYKPVITGFLGHWSSLG